MIHVRGQWLRVPLATCRHSIATIPGIAGNMITGAILSGHEDDWGLIFSIGAGINIFGAIVFLIYAKGEPQFDD